MTAPTGIDARSYARVEVIVPARVRVLSHDDAETLADRYAVEPTYTERITGDLSRSVEGQTTWERQALGSIVSRLDRLEQTIGRIAEAVGVDPTSDDVWIEGETVNLSGSGLGIRIPQRIDDDTPVEVELTLLGDPTVTIRGIGRVASVVNPDGDALPVGRFHLGIALVAMHAEDREALVKHTFKVQRAMLRERRDSDE